MMSTIFSQASEVIAWLGSPSGSIEGLLSSIRGSARLYSEYRHQVKGLPSVQEQKRTSPETDTKGRGSLSAAITWNWKRIQMIFLISSLAELLTRPYWGRLWILQEIILPKRRTLFCGSEHCDMDDILAMLSSWPKLMVARVGKPLWTHPLMVEKTVRTKGLSATDAVYRWAGAECADPRDKIFGLAALIKEEERPRIDYFDTVASVFAESCVWLCLHGFIDREQTAIERIEAEAAYLEPADAAGHIAHAIWQFRRDSKVKSAFPFEYLAPYLSKAAIRSISRKRPDWARYILQHAESSTRGIMWRDKIPERRYTM